VRHEQLGEFRLALKHANDLRLSDPHDHAIRDCNYRSQAERLASQAALAKEITLSVESNDRLFPSLGNDRDFNLSALDVEDGVRRVTLREHQLIFAITRYSPLAVHGTEESLHIERTLLFLSHDDFYLPFRDDGHCSAPVQFGTSFRMEMP
jgi:hypothetical protein